MAGTANSLITPQTVKTAAAACTTANTTYTASPTNTQVLFTAGSNGARITRVSAIPITTVAATQLQLFRDLDGTGTNKRFFNSAVMASYTMAASTAAPVTDMGYSDSFPLILAPGEKLYAAIGVSNAINFVAEGADY